MHYKINWAVLLLEGKLKNCNAEPFLLCYILSHGKEVPGGKSPGAYILRADLTEVFCIKSLGGLTNGGVYFPNFTYNIGREISEI